MEDDEEQEAVGEMGGAVPGETNNEESKLLFKLILNNTFLTVR